MTASGKHATTQNTIEVPMPHEGVHGYEGSWVVKRGNPAGEYVLRAGVGV